MDKTSLFFRVFSAKFFPSASVLDAKSSRGSFAWQTIIKARSVIKKGMIWRIGDGKNVFVFHDNWIPDDFPSKAISCRLDVSDKSMISTMIDTGSRAWNEELLRNSIAPLKIMAILICRIEQEDCLVWPRSRRGSYTVRTGFQHLCELNNSAGASSSNLAAQKIFWKHIWKLKNSK